MPARRRNFASPLDDAVLSEHARRIATLTAECEVLRARLITADRTLQRLDDLYHDLVAQVLALQEKGVKREC